MNRTLKTIIVVAAIGAALVLLNILPVDARGEYPLSPSASIVEISNLGIKANGVPVATTKMKYMPILNKDAADNIVNLVICGVNSYNVAHVSHITIPTVKFSQWGSEGPIAFHMNGTLYFRINNVNLSNDNSRMRDKLVLHELAHYLNAEQKIDDTTVHGYMFYKTLRELETLTINCN